MIQQREDAAKEQVERIKKLKALFDFMQSISFDLHSLTKKALTSHRDAKDTNNDDDINIKASVAQVRPQVTLIQILAESVPTATVLRQSYIKTQALLGLSLLSDYPDIYCANTSVHCEAIKETFRFALNTDHEDDISKFLAGSVSSNKMSILSKISRGRSKAHEYIQRDIVATIFSSDCLTVYCAQAPTHPILMLGNARAKARTVDLSSLESLQNALPDAALILSSVTLNDENESRQDTLHMSIC
eukprot:IDg22626t1